MKVLITNEGAATIIRPQGPVIAGEIVELDNELRRLSKNWVKRIVLNLSDASLIDSAGLELICDYQDQLEEHGLKMKLCGLNELVQRIFELTRLTRRFDIFPDMTAAVRSFL